MELVVDEVVMRRRRAFRHLKRGTFPPDLISEYTCGRTKELSLVESHLKDATSGASRHLFVEGTYGQGKSHFLKVIESVALEREFAVSWVTLDGYRHAPNHPSRYLRAFLENLKIPGSDKRGLAAAVSSWLCNEKAQSILDWAEQSFSWASFPIRVMAEGADNQYDGSYYLESRDIVRKNGKIAFALVSQRIQQTAGLMRAAGLKGLVLLFDELESIATLLWGIRQRYLSYEFLNLLIDGRRHPHCMFVFAATPDLAIRLDSDRSHREYYATHYPGGCRFITKWSEGTFEKTRLHGLTSDDLLELCRRLRRFHIEAYEHGDQSRLTDNYLAKLVEDSRVRGRETRELIRWVVIALETIAQNPGVAANDVFQELLSVK